MKQNLKGEMKSIMNSRLGMTQGIAGTPFLNNIYIYRYIFTSFNISDSGFMLESGFNQQKKEDYKAFN